MGVSLEAWLGAIIAVVIVKAGIGILHETLSGILGERIDGNLSRGVKQAICEMEGVRGADDLLLTDYGPERLQGSVYIEVDDAMTARDIDLLTRRIKQMVLLRFNVIITAVGIYSVNSADAKAALLRDSIEAIAKRYEHVLGLHGFYLDEPMRCVYFDIIIDFAAADREEEYRAVMNDVREAYPGYTFTTTMDSDVSD